MLLKYAHIHNPTIDFTIRLKAARFQLTKQTKKLQHWLKRQSAVVWRWRRNGGRERRKRRDSKKKKRQKKG